jgi:hypothetical protein
VQEVPHVFRNALRPIANLALGPSSPGTREPIFVAIPSDHPRKKGAMMQKANVSHDKRKMDKMVRGRGLPCVRRSRALRRVRVVRRAMPVSLGKKRMKKQRRSNKRNDGKRGSL